ncbi:unnamed protein product, partial [Rotaria magnacalcarata]
CDPNAGCSHDNTTNAVECTCKTGYTNTGVARNVTRAPSAMELVIQTPVAHTTTQRMQWFAHAKLTRAPSAMELAIRTPVAHTTTQRMQWFAHAKLITPTLE